MEIRNYCNFIRSFENLIEVKTESSSTKRYYLVQYTSGDAQDLMRSCLSIQLDDRRLSRSAQTSKGKIWQIAFAYVTRVTNGPLIKHEDGKALQKFSILLMSCKNTLREVGYLNKIENPDSKQRGTAGFPFR